MGTWICAGIDSNENDHYAAAVALKKAYGMSVRS